MKNKLSKTLSFLITPYLVIPVIRSFARGSYVQITITVNPPSPVSISGRIVDRDSNGIEGVTVTLKDYPDEQAVIATATTNSTGNYVLSNIPTFSNYILRAEKLNYTFSPNKRVYINLSTNQTADFTGTLNLQPSDFDGDGKTDVAVYRPSTGYWYVRRASDGTILTRALGSQSHGDRAVPGNYDGDQMTDMAVFADGNWSILLSSSTKLRQETFGKVGDKPVAADYDGDGKTDLAIYRPTWSTFYIQFSSDSSVHGVQWGLEGDVAARGDFDGDGKADIAVFRPANGTWYILRSSNNTLLAEHWGTSGDQPVPGDYDLDGKTDIAVFRPSNSNWYVSNSSNGLMQTQSWGMDGDIAIPFAYLPQ